MDDATYERVLDRRVQQRLRTDSAYRNAANAEEQAEAEAKIERQETLRLDLEIERREFSAAHAEGLHSEVPREFCPDCEAEGRRA